MKTVLIIDDNPVITSIYRGKLAAEGLHTEIGVNGDEGLKMLDRCKPDVVLLDLMLPKVNGMEVLQRIRARPDYKNLPVIVFSNSYSPEIMQQAWGYGATDVLHKSNTTPRNVVLALVRAIGGNAAPAAAAAVAPSAEPMQAAPARTVVDRAASPADQIAVLLQKFAAGEIASGSGDFVRLMSGGGLGEHFAAPMLKLFAAIEVLVAVADQAVAGPARELCHDSIRAIARVCRQTAGAAEGSLLSPVAVSRSAH
ncbi:MAG: response regulator [Acidobacteriota bacterium]